MAEKTTYDIVKEELDEINDDKEMNKVTASYMLGRIDVYYSNGDITANQRLKLISKLGLTLEDMKNINW